MTKHYGRESFSLPLEQKDDNGGAPRQDVIDEVKREISSFGNDFKSMRDSMQRDLTAVRKLAEEAKDSPELKSQIEALTTSVTEKHTALQTAFDEQKRRTEELETALNRPGFAGGDKKSEEMMAEAIRFFETKASASGSLKWRDRPTAKTVDVESYKAWEEQFSTYLRADDRAVEAKALSVGSNPDGGYLVPTARSNRIIQKIYETSPLRQLATVETIGTEAMEIPIDQDEAGAGWIGEEEYPTETSTPRIGVQRIPVHEMYAKPKATQQILEDASVDVEAWLATKVAERFSRIEATAFMTGNGVKKPRGILTYPAGNAGARQTVAQYASGNATSITADAIVAMPFYLKGAYLSNATWLMKRSTVQSIMLLKDGQGQYLWRPGLLAGQPSSLVGYSVQMADDMPAVANGNLSVAFGDFRRAYTVLDRLGITTLRDPYSAKPFVEFYTRKRVGGDVVDFEAYALMKVAAS